MATASLICAFSSSPFNSLTANTPMIYDSSYNILYYIKTIIRDILIIYQVFN